MPVSRHRRHTFLVAALFCLLILPSCSSDKSRFVLEGNFRNMNQADFFVFDTRKGSKDTIHVQRGRFKFERTLPDTTVLLLMFPNYSTLPIFAHGGASVKLKGDASHLRETKVTGSDENDDMTEFRLGTSQLTPPEVEEAAARYIMDHPASPVSLYMLQYYFVQAPMPDYGKGLRLSAVIHAAVPTNLQAVVLHKQLQELSREADGKRLPRFAVLDMKGKLRTNKDLGRKVNIVCLYSSCNTNAVDLLHTAQQLQRKHSGDMALMGISIDATSEESNILLRRDTITCPVICTGDMWQTPLARKMGLVRIPEALIADRNGRVVRHHITTPIQLREEVNKLLEDK